MVRNRILRVNEDLNYIQVIFVVFKDNLRAYIFIKLANNSENKHLSLSALGLADPVSVYCDWVG